jgi:spermidine synthase
LSLGALALSGRIERSPAPWRWYAGCELVIALWALALTALLDPATRALLAWIGPTPSPLRHLGVALLGTLTLLLPATVAMGATLPALENALGRRHDGGRTLALLYACNTAGAVAGVLATAFALVPGMGLLRTALLCAVLNLLCAAVAGTLAVRRPVPDATPTPPGVHGRGILMTLFLTGLLGIGYEVLVVRVLTQVTENTVYTFAIVLAVYLVATAAGAAGFGRWFASRADARTQRDGLLLALAAACAAGTAALALAPESHHRVAQVLGTGAGAALGAEAAVAASALLLPALLMGALFSLLTGMARAAGTGVGRAVGVNAIGAAVAPALFGVALAPAMSAKFALLAVAAGYLLLLARRSWTRPATGVAAATVAAVAVAGPALVIVHIPAGGRLLSHVQGVLSTVSVVEDAGGTATLHIDNRQQEGSTATLLADARQAVLPLLLHPAPANALFLGLGTGATAAVAARETGLRVEVVELLPEVIRASGLFLDRLDQRLPGPRPAVVNADARRFIRSGEARYDVIVSDNFHPARSGSAALYTVEHFAAVQARLAPGGVFCQWLPLHQMDLDTLRSIVASFRSVYPHAWALLATYSLETPVIGLVARRDGERFEPATLRERISTMHIAGGAGAFGVPDDVALLGTFVAGPGALAQFAADMPPNTDDHPVVAYRAPRITYTPDSTPAERLIALVREVRIDPAELLATPNGNGSPDGLPARLEQYWKARERFLEVGVGVHPAGDARAMLRQVREPLLDVLRLSPDFRPAYDPLLRMAGALSDEAPADATALLQALRQAAPARPEAAAALQALQATHAR